MGIKFQGLLQEGYGDLPKEHLYDNNNINDKSLSTRLRFGIEKNGGKNGKDRIFTNFFNNVEWNNADQLAFLLASFTLKFDDGTEVKEIEFNPDMKNYQINGYSHLQNYIADEAGFYDWWDETKEYIISSNSNRNPNFKQYAVRHEMFNWQDDLDLGNGWKTTKFTANQGHPAFNYFKRGLKSDDKDVIFDNLDSNDVSIGRQIVHYDLPYNHQDRATEATKLSIFMISNRKLIDIDI